MSTYYAINDIQSSVYEYSNIYESYITNKITNEEAIATHLNTIIPMNEASYRNIRAVNEAKISDKVKVKFDKIVAFIKNLLAKFMESISNILLNEKQYLEKYKDIILRKAPKHENEYSYTGDYATAVQRCINFQIPTFNYNTYAKDLQQDDSDAATTATVNKIMQGQQGFSFNNGDSISTQFKEYFLAWDKGETQGTFDDGKLNFKDMYNFCIKVKDIETIKKKDENYIETTTKAIRTTIEQAIAKNQSLQNNQQQTHENDQVDSSSKKYTKTELEDAVKKADEQLKKKEEYQKDNPEDDKAIKDVEAARKVLDELRSKQNNGDYIEESAISMFRSLYLMEDNNKDQNNDSKAGGTNTLKVTSAVTKIKNDSSNRQSLSDDEVKNNAEGGENDEVAMVQRAADRWLHIVQTIIAARCTALQQIAKNYMEIIRVHVRSYVGNEKDKTTNRTQDPEINYENGNNNIDNNGKYKNKFGQKNVERHRKKRQEK